LPTSHRIQGIEDFATLISCLDYRIDSFGIARPNKHTYVNRLRTRVARGEYGVVHLSYLRPLGIGLAAGIVRDKSLARAVMLQQPLDNKILERIDVPMPHMAWNIILLDDQRIFISWYMPVGFSDRRIREWVEERGEWLGRGWKLPVHTCLPRPTPDDIPELAKRFHELIAQPLLRLRAPIIAYILVALLDKYPLAPLREIASLSMIAAARDLDAWLQKLGVSERLRWRFVLRYYKNLSTHYAVGRYRLVYPAQIRRGLPIIVAGPVEEASRLYGLFALYGAAHMIMLERRVFTALRLPPEDAAKLVSLASRMGGEIHSYKKVYLFPLPFEYYDPLENRWMEERVDKIPDALRKLRYVISHT